jgi:hypothetical protein
MKVGQNKFKKEKKQILLYSWLPTKTYHKNLAIWILFCFEIWQIFGPFFFMKIPSYRLKSYFSHHNLTKLHPKKTPVTT